MRAGMRGRSATAIVVALLALAASVLASPPASAAAYRYWTYWQAPDGAWAFATAGPATTVPEDGAVEGWRFAVTTEAGSAKDAPRASASFAELCNSTPTAPDRKRVGLVVDPGLPADAPSGQTPGASLSTCVSVPMDATGYQVLRAALTVRVGDTGLICGIGGYPADECAALVEASDERSPTNEPTQDVGADPSASTEQDGAQSPLPLVAGIAAIAALVAAALVIRRRRA